MGTHISDSLPAFAKNYEDRHLLSSTTQSPSCSNLDGDEVLPRPSYYTSPVMRKDLSSVIQGRYSWHANSQRPFDGQKDAEQCVSSTTSTWHPNTPPVSIAEFENCPYNYTDYETMSTNYTSSPVVVSPRGWSAASDQSDWNSPIEQSRHQALSNDGRPLHSHLSCDLPEISDVNIALNYPRYYHDFESEPPNFIRKPHPAPMLSDTPPYSSIPGAEVDPSNIFSSMRDHPCTKEGSEFIISGHIPSATANSRAMDASKNGEPYARLIYRAFMSVPTHAMTLQEIYEWFRVNTDKANSPGKDGWKNSIRHNLSMNHAFVRREKNQGTELGAGGPPPIPQPAGDARKSTEWVLEDWALRDGVQSTTRYRPKGSHSLKRGRHSPLSHNVTYHANPKHPHLSRPGRAVSGEKGGFATSRGRRKARHGAPPTSAGVLSQQMSMLELQMGTDSGQAPYQFSQHHQHHQLPLASEQVVMYENAYSNQPPPHGETGLASPSGPGGAPAGLDFGLSGPNTVASVGSLQQPDAYDFSQYSLSDVGCVYPAGRFSEGGNMLYVWGQDSYQTPSGNGSPATP
ncbi:forkhead domain-containing protein [Verticillium dahliae]|nr:forkhead domain-containing protein [Verticillium dahliae]